MKAATLWSLTASGFRPRIKYGVTFFRRNDGDVLTILALPHELVHAGAVAEADVDVAA